MVDKRGDAYRDTGNVRKVYASNTDQDNLQLTEGTMSCALNMDGNKMTRLHTDTSGYGGDAASWDELVGRRVVSILVQVTECANGQRYLCKDYADGLSA